MKNEHLCKILSHYALNEMKIGLVGDTLTYGILPDADTDSWLVIYLTPEGLPNKMETGFFNEQSALEFISNKEGRVRYQVFSSYHHC